MIIFFTDSICLKLKQPIYSFIELSFQISYFYCVFLLSYITKKIEIFIDKESILINP
jgi:hypothetical protein